MVTLRLSQYRPLRNDIERLNKYAIKQIASKRKIEIEKDLLNLPEDLKNVLLQCINKNVRILRTKDLRFKNFSDILKKYDLRIEYDI